MAKAKKSGSSFFRELKRRKVMRTSLYYVILWWIALQVADIVLPALGYDADAASLVLLYMAIIGFPVNFALAWYFQITTKGVVVTTSFVERRILNNIAPINDQRHGAVTTYFQKEERKDFTWIISAETGPLSGLSFGVTAPTVLGRALDCEIAIVTPHVSRRHARLEVTEHALTVEDLGSSNGTVVNGKAIQGRHALHHEDELRLHDIIFRVTESYSGLRQEKDSLNQTTFIEKTPPEDPPENP
jgi:hypothetical protein